MKWLNIEVAMLRSPEYVGSEPVARATWLNLLAYCADQENGGVIKGCKGWKDRQWQQTCGITRDEAMLQGMLEGVLEAMIWRWVGDDLHVWGYPKTSEAALKAKRKGGAKGGKASARATSQAMLQGMLEGMHEGVLERKGKGKGKGNDCTHTSAVIPPTLTEVLEAAKLIGITEDVATKFWHSCEERPITPDGGWTLRDGKPMNMSKWRNSLSSFAIGFQNNQRPDQKAKPPAKSKYRDDF